MDYEDHFYDDGVSPSWVDRRYFERLEREYYNRIYREYYDRLYREYYEEQEGEDEE